MQLLQSKTTCTLGQTGDNVMKSLVDFEKQTTHYILQHSPEMLDTVKNYLLRQGKSAEVVERYQAVAGISVGWLKVQLSDFRLSAVNRSAGRNNNQVAAAHMLPSQLRPVINDYKLAFRFQDGLTIKTKIAPFILSKLLTSAADITFEATYLPRQSWQLKPARIQPDTDRVYRVPNEMLLPEYRANFVCNGSLVDAKFVLVVTQQMPVQVVTSIGLPYSLLPKALRQVQMRGHCFWGEAR